MQPLVLCDLFKDLFTFDEADRTVGFAFDPVILFYEPVCARWPQQRANL